MEMITVSMYPIMLFIWAFLAIMGLVTVALIIVCYFVDDGRFEDD